MKKYLFILAGVAFFSLLTCSSAFALDTLPTTSSGNVDLDSVDGFARRATPYTTTYINLACHFDRTGSINAFPLGLNNDDSFTTSPCGYGIFNGELRGPFNQDSNFRYRVYFDSNGRQTQSPNWFNTIRDSLYDGGYLASRYVSAFQSFEPRSNLINSNYSSNTFPVPLTEEDGYMFYIYTLSNLSNYHTTTLAPLLPDGAVVVPNNASRSADDVLSVINGSAYLGWVWTDNTNTKKSTLTECSDDKCFRVLADGETFSAIEDYIFSLEDGSYFAIYAIPTYTDMTYSFTPTFITPSNATAYGVDFERFNEEEVWGFPMVYSDSYQSLFYNGSTAIDPLNVELFDTYSSILLIRPTTSEAFSKSRIFAGQLVQAHSNALRYQNGLSKIEPNPGYNLWSNIFNLGNLIFPLQSFLSGFTNAQCVDIPILGSWLGIGANTNYCSWWSADIRNVLTPVFAASSMMLLFGFIVHWLRKDAQGLNVKEVS